MTFRPTAPQAVGLGAYLGGLVGTTAGLIMVAVQATGVWARFGAPTWTAVLGPAGAGLVVGAGVGLALGRRAGADVDETGIHLAPRSGDTFAPWHAIEDLRAERRGGRTYVAVCLATGQTALLRAPYDGQLLARDPAFERKLFMLRNLWETQRYSSAPKDDDHS